MNFEQKLNVVLEEMKNVYGLSDSHISIIKLNVMKRVQLYKGINYVKNDNECSFLVSDDFIGDMFINRLINNIRHYDFSPNYNLNEKLKGSFAAQTQELSMSNYGSVSDLTRDRLSSIPGFNEQMLYDATIKVMNHELGHAFQNGFSGSLGNHSADFNNLISSLMKKYPGEFKIDDFSHMKRFQKGMIPERLDDNNKKMRDYYAPHHDLASNLDEIFNEEESLEVTGIKNPQFQYNFGDGFVKDIYNYESSNYKITSYATLMKILMGKQRTFDSMYIDCTVCYDFFDKFDKLAEKVFAGSKYATNSPMLNVLNALYEVKKNNNIEEAKKLDLFFTVILRMKAKDVIQDTNLTIEQLDEFEKDVAVFKTHMLHSNSIKMEQDVIVSEIEELINKKKIELTNGINKVPSDDMKYVAQQMRQAQADNDEVAYEYWKANFDRLIEKSEFDDDGVGVSISENYSGPAM